MNRLVFHIVIGCMLLCLPAGAATSRTMLELRVMISGRLFLGIGVAHKLDPNTSIRVGSVIGVSGSPVGFNVDVMQETSSHQWTPYFGIGAELFVFKQSGEFTTVSYPRGMVGYAYRPNTGLSHNAELCLAYLWKQHRFRPVGISFVHLNRVY